VNSGFQFAVPDLDVGAILAILIVALTGIIALIAEMCRPKRSNDLIVAISVAGLILAGLAAFRTLGESASDAFAGMYIVDRFGSMMQLIVLLGTLLAVFFSESYLREKGIPFGEVYPLMLWSATGAMIMAATTNLLVIFLGLEILSVALYVMAGISRGEEKSNESALKYFLLGAFSSGFLLYGIAFIYGATNSLSLERIVTAAGQHHAGSHAMLLLGIGLVSVGLGFKTSLVPFHQWTPDVYQGAPTNITAFMSTVTKAGAFAALVRVLEASTSFRGEWMPAFAFIAVLTMTVGNLVALSQRDVKRILGYSSIAQAGYVLVAVLAHVQRPVQIGTGTIVYYLFGYTAMTAGAFAVVSLTAKDGQEGTRLEDLRGLWKRAPYATVALIIFMASLIGLPPTVGFIGKLQIFTDAIQAGLAPLAIALAVNSVISTYYYLGIVFAAISSDSREPETRPLRFNWGVASTCALSVVGVFGAILPPVFQALVQR
jgi:NADH-quinone oxidoreductase subunit N